MPKNNHDNQAAQEARTQKININKELITSKLKIWKSERRQQIDASYNETLNKIPVEQQKIREQAQKDLEKMEADLKAEWKERNKAERFVWESDCKRLNAENGKRLIEINIKYNDLIDQERTNYEKEAKEAEDQFIEEVKKQRAYLNERKQELEKVKKENEAKNQSIEKSLTDLYADVDRLTAEINKKNRRREDATKLEHQLDDLEVPRRSLLTAKAALIKQETDLQEEISILNKQLNPETVKAKLIEVKNPIYSKYKAKTGALNDELGRAQSAEKAETEKKIKETEKRLAEDEAQPYNRGKYGYLSDKLESKTSNALKDVEDKLKKEAEDTRKAAEEELEENGIKLGNRLYKSAEFTVDVDLLTNSDKRGTKPNTTEFTLMVNALGNAARSVGQFGMSAEIEENIRRDCLEAYKQCKNYLNAKKREGRVANYFRSFEGKERIRMATEMVAKLKEFYPELDQALEAEKNHVQVQAEPQNAAGHKTHKEPKINVSAELDAAKIAAKKELGMNGDAKQTVNLQTGVKKTNVENKVKAPAK